MVAFIGQWATDGTGVTDEEYAQGMKSSDIEMNTRYMWKYVARDRSYWLLSTHAEAHPACSMPLV